MLGCGVVHRDGEAEHVHLDQLVRTGHGRVRHSGSTESRSNSIASSSGLPVPAVRSSNQTTLPPASGSTPHSLATALTRRSPRPLPAIALNDRCAGGAWLPSSISTRTLSPRLVTRTTNGVRA